MDRIEFGMPTLIELEALEDCAALARELGLKFVEINMNMPQYQAGRLRADALARAGADGLYFTFHLDENFNPSDFNPRVARAYLDTPRETVALARLVRAPVVNLHMAQGIAFSLPDRMAYLFEIYRGQYLDGLAAFREICQNAAGAGGVSVCVENTDGFRPFMREGLERLLSSDLFGLTLDIGHSHAAGGVDEEFIAAHREKLTHMHIHDARGEKCHLALGSGEIDLPGRLRLAADRGCRCVIEAKTVAALRSSVDWLRRGRYLCSPTEA